MTDINVQVAERVMEERKEIDFTARGKFRLVVNPEKKMPMWYKGFLELIGTRLFGETGSE